MFRFRITNNFGIMNFLEDILQDTSERGLAQSLYVTEPDIKRQKTHIHRDASNTYQCWSRSHMLYLMHK
jgi:hypothetical protein